MALTFTNDVDVRGVDQTVLVVSGTVGTDAEVILRGNLTDWDVDQLTKIEATITGAITTWAQAFAAYTMPNGQTGTEYFANHIFDLEAANAAWVAPYSTYGKVIKDTFAANAVTLADHEARITVLEP